MQKKKSSTIATNMTTKSNIDPRECGDDVISGDQQIKASRITVIIPTRNRKNTLRKTLEAYGEQTTDPREFNLIIVDDGSVDGTPEAVSRWINDFPYQITLLTQPNGGPAKARNQAICRVQCALVLITGDDIIPHPKLIETHLEAHTAYPDPNIAILGYVDWHKDLQVSDFMTYITKVDGHQFAYHNIADTQDVDFGYFYTSNVSLKTSFLRQGKLFSESFRYAACEDVELGYRLKKHGMRLILVPEAIGYHLHPMDLESFSQRQFKVGQMMALLQKLHPGIIDIETPSPPEVTLRKISAMKSTLEDLETYVAKKTSFSEMETKRIRQLRFQVYREIIYGYQALGLSEEQQQQELSLSAQP